MHGAACCSWLVARRRRPRRRRRRRFRWTRAGRSRRAGREPARPPPRARANARASSVPVDPGGSIAGGGRGAGAPPSASEVNLEQLAPGQVVRGFSPQAVYLDAGDHPIGARLVHVKTGFTLDYLRIESAPQALLCVTTYPTSDQEIGRASCRERV